MMDEMYELPSPTNKKYYPYELSPIKSKMQIHVDIFPEINMITSLAKCKRLEQEIKSVLDKDCPICFTEIGDINCVIPQCGHKVCIPCFIQNIKSNRQTGDCCVICRKKYD